ncbi:NB-ARC domain-containing protein [Kitasatospora sp. NPDC056273]|uniref:NB-ARC domain-containing protein n=1 Tax=Kitasatospora sp. NPDC056273 TaxID=3345769 RepID=UPI0035D711F6
MPKRGGQAAAAGFQYQYLVTLEALLEALEDARHDIAAAVIEPSGHDNDSDESSPGTADTDAIDYYLVDDLRRPVVAAQVKSGGPDTELSAPAAYAILLRMVRACPTAESYQLITNKRLHPKAVRLKQALTHGGDLGTLRAALRQALDRSSKLSSVDDLRDNDLRALGRARIKSDLRDPHEFRDQLRERIREHRARHRDGLGHQSAGRMSNHLVSEIHHRAAGESEGVLELEAFRSELLTESRHLAWDLGAFDWGIMIGPVPSVPDVPRSEVLSRVRAALADSPGPRVPSSCALLGLSGIGKTSLAAAYAHDTADSYDWIFWVNAESTASLMTSFRRIHEWLHPQGDRAPDDDTRLQDGVRALLSASAERWLLIFDNATDRHSLHPWMPSSGRGHVIVTSTNQAGWAAHPHKIDVQALTPTEAGALVRLRLADDSPWDEHAERAAMDLSAALAHWPLALELACGYLLSCELGLAEVPRYLRSIRDLALDDERSVPAGYPHTLVAAIHFALERVDRYALPQRPFVSEIAMSSVQAAGYLGSRQIPLHLLIAIAVVPDELAYLDTPEPIVLQDDPGNSFNSSEVHRALWSESLVRRDAPLCARPPEEWSEAHPEEVDQTISVNEIVQYVVRGRVERDRATVERVLRRSALHVQLWLAAFLRHGDERHALAVMPHAQSLAEHAQRLGFSSSEVAILWGNLAGAHLERGELAAARRLFEAELAYVLGCGPSAAVLELKIRMSLAELAELEAAPVEQLLAQGRRVHQLAGQLCDSHPLDVAHIVANLLVTLRTMTRRGGPNDEVLELMAKFTQLLENLPSTAETRLLAEIEQLNHGLGTSALRDDEVEQRCRAMLAGGQLSPRLRVALTGLLAEALCYQRRWSEVARILEHMENQDADSRFHPRGITNVLHNLGLPTGMSALHRDQDAQDVLATLLRIASLLESTHLESEPSMPVKLGALRLVSAICTNEESSIRGTRRELRLRGALQLLSAEHDAGWRVLLASSILISLELAPDSS